MEDEIEKLTSSIYAQIVREQDEATMQMIENYVKEKQRSGEICLSNIIGEGKIRHIFNLGLTEYARIQKEPIKVLSKNYFPESVYVEFLNEKIKSLESENKSLLDNNSKYIKDSIPNSKIKAKIEELKGYINDCMLSEHGSFCEFCKERCSFNENIEILQELLKEEE